MSIRFFQFNNPQNCTDFSLEEFLNDFYHKITYANNNNDFKNFENDLIKWYNWIFYQHGIGTCENRNKALDLYLLNINDNNSIIESEKISNHSNNDHLKKYNIIIGKYLLSFFYYSQNIAFKWTMRSENQEISTQFQLGNCYYHVNKLDKDEHQEFKLYLTSAKECNLIAQNNVGDCYCFGRGIDKNYDKAFEWYLKSAERGNLKGQKENHTAQNNLGYCYQHGIGVNINEKKAFECYSRSSEGGNPGQNNLGYCYQYGIGISINEKNAFEWYLKSVGGSHEGKDNLSYCY
ncbi:hypothetical protein C1645_839701 [Glomus cerebriforme]|uniref:Sel1 repeat protein n=1 Tax=Glomus cerebriforme TaxID=658196 RepID=A0A397S077_9GLOM|nr:hypothetical protein C1645_839701 [Glomus cerebriforme]